MTALFGWCLDGLHGKCPAASNSGTCSCACHTGDGLVEMGDAA